MKFVRPIILHYAMMLILSNTSFAQTHVYQNCAEREIPYKAYVSGFENVDSISISDILKSGKLESANKAFEIQNFVVAFGGDCLIAGEYSEIRCDGNRFSDVTKNAIRRINHSNQYLYFDCIKVKNKLGKTYALKPFRCKLIWGK